MYSRATNDSIRAALQELRPGLDGERLDAAHELWMHWFGGTSPDDVPQGTLAAFLAGIDRGGPAGAGVPG